MSPTPVPHRNTFRATAADGAHVLSIAAYRAITALDTVLTAVAALAAAVRQRQQRRRAINELARLDDRLLADIGIARHEIARVVDGLEPRRSPRRAGHTARAGTCRRPAANDNDATLAA